MEFLNYKSCLADPDMWMRPAIKSDGNTYYEYILLYVDNELVVSENAEIILRNELGRYFHLKEESIGPPTVYLGGRVRKVQLENGVWAWSFSSSQYVQSAIKNVEEYVGRPKNSHLKIPSKADTPHNKLQARVGCVTRADTKRFCLLPITHWDIAVDC